MAMYLDRVLQFHQKGLMEKYQAILYLFLPCLFLDVNLTQPADLVNF